MGMTFIGRKKKTLVYFMMLLSKESSTSTLAALKNSFMKLLELTHGVAGK